MKAVQKPDADGANHLIGAVVGVHQSNNKNNQGDINVMANETNDGLNISGENLQKLEQMANDLDKAGASSGAAAADINVCEQYNRIKPVLQSALPIIRLIPRFGRQVADAIEFLMGIADTFCAT